MSDSVNFYCLGAVHTDVKAYAQINPAIGESIPVRSTRCIGGVACNVAVNLAKCGARVAIASLVGNDQEGKLLVEALKSRGIDTDDIEFSNSWPTARYYAMLTPQGELFIAMADMSIYHELKPDLVINNLHSRELATDWIVDANVPGDTIEALARHVKNKDRLWGIGVSVHKTKIFCRGFPYWYGLILNRQELIALSGHADLAAGINALKDQGCKRIVVTSGSQGVHYFDGDEIIHKRSKPVHIVDVTGAGDALCAGLVLSLIHI